MDEFRSLQELVEHRLRGGIIQGEFLPGTPLLERELSERYGVSRGPLREALRALQAQGLVVHNRNKGVRVAQLSLKEMTEIYEMRVALEGLASRKAAEVAGQRDVGPVSAAYKQLVSIPIGDPTWLTANNEFHCSIYGTAERPHLLATIRQLMDRVEPYIRLYLEIPDHFSQSIEEHERIWQAFVDGDQEASEQLIQEHLEKAGKIMEVMLGQAGGGEGDPKGEPHVRGERVGRV
jgi:DNA-binding GntR family transcriptional regulator